jgi:hypothetical protein
MVQQVTSSKLIFAIIFIAIQAINTPAWGQKVYKCGSNYSNFPCEGAVAVPVDDTRTSAQKSQSMADTQEQKRKADAMEKTRLQEEKEALKANTPQDRPAQKSVKPPKAKQQKKSEPKLFVAMEPVDLEKAKAAKTRKKSRAPKTTTPKN